MRQRVTGRVSRNGASARHAVPAAVLILLAMPAAARSAPPAASASRGLATVAEVALRGDEHLGFSRVEIDLPPGIAPQLTWSADSVRVRLPGARLQPPNYWPRRVRELVVAGDAATMTLAPGVRLRQSALGDRLVLDLLDPPPLRRYVRAAPPAIAMPAPVVPTTPRVASPATALLPPMASPAPALPAASTPPGSSTTPEPSKVPVPLAAPAPPPPIPATLPAATPPAPPAPATLPAAVAAREPLGVAAVPVGDTGSVLLPFASGTAAAALRRGGEALLVFDDPRPIDVAPLRGMPTLSDAQVQLLPAATLLRLPLRAGMAVRLREVAGGWRLTLLQTGLQAGLPVETPASAPVTPIVATAAAGLLRLAAPPPDRMLPGRVVTVRDPATGALLLVGTVHGASAADAPYGVAIARRTPEFTLLKSWQGVAIEPLSDAVELRPEAAGFVVRSGQAGHTLALAADTLAATSAAASSFSRRFDFPALPMAALSQRLQAAADAAAAAPPLRRAPARLAAAQAMLALGMSTEAQALVQLAIADGARLADDPQARAIGAAAAILAERAPAAADIDDPSLVAPGQPGADEVMLWRTLRLTQDVTASAAAAAGPLPPEAARSLASRLPLLLSYPPPLRRRLLPRALEALALGGGAAAAQEAVAALPDDRSLDLARAELAAVSGHVAEALPKLDALARGVDRDVRDRAAVQAVELRLATHRLDPAQAAEALDRLTYAWRGDGRELALRLRVAELRAQADQYRASLALLREAAAPGLAQSWPDRVETIRGRAADTLAQALARDAQSPLPPLELVALAEENAELLPNGEAGQLLAQRLADRLCALDLPDRAAPALRKLVDAAPAGPVRAGLGVRLAQLRMDQDQPGEALLALSASTAPDLDAALSDRRTVLFARATAARGNLPAALGALSAVATPAADELRAQLLESAARWPEAEAALARWVARALPVSGPLDAAQSALLLRLAAAAAQAGDVPALERLRSLDLTRIARGHAADTLELLTQRPVRELADLPRAAREASLTHAALH